MLMNNATRGVIALKRAHKPKCVTGVLIFMVESHNRTETESPSHAFGISFKISKKLFLELCKPSGNSFQ